MNAFNRLVMLIISLLLIAVPVFLLLVGFGVIPADEVNEYTNYRGALNSLGGLSVSDFNPGVRTVAGIVGALVALVALLLLLRELTFGRPVARRAYIEDTPGQETVVTAHGLSSVGAADPSCRLASDNDRRYEVLCDIQVSRTQNFTELASRTRDNIRRVLEVQQVPVKDVEVTVRGTAS